MPITPIPPEITGRDIFEDETRSRLKGRDGYFEPKPDRRPYRGRHPKFKRGNNYRAPKDYCVCHGKRVNRLVIESEFGFYVEKCKCAKSNSKRKRSKRRRHIPTYSRYRVRNPTFERFGNVVAGTKLGTFKRYSNNQLVENTLVHSTGNYNGSITVERTWDCLHPGPPYIDVSPFANILSQVPGAGRTNEGKHVNFFSPGNWWEYSGDFLDNGDWGTDSSSNYFPTAIPTVTGYDTLAWDKLKPIIPQASAAQFIGELRDLPRQLKTSAEAMHNAFQAFRGKSGKIIMPPSVADNFLNWEFGWAPFISDLGKFYSTWKDAHRIISDITANNGKWRKRRRVLEESYNQNLVVRKYYPGVDPWGNNIQGTCLDFVVDGVTCKGYMDITEVVHTKVWATGQFTYYRPEFDPQNPAFGGVFDIVGRLATIYGLRINPTLIWQLTPWSWLVDWGAGLGNHIRRLDDFVIDGIVSRNLCVMRTIQRFMTKTSVINFADGPRTLSWKRNVTQKVRKLADSPYGFDVSWNNFSARQAAILGALGFSRGVSGGFIARG